MDKKGLKPDYEIEVECGIKETNIPGNGTKTGRRIRMEWCEGEKDSPQIFYAGEFCV